MSNAVAPILEPDSDAMRRQLEHVFLGDLDGAHNGLIELAWNDPRNGALSAAALFGTDRIVELVEQAVALNRTPGVNVYVGAALRRPDAMPDRRGADADFHAASCIWADVDSDVVAPAIASCKRRGVPPTMTVVTGRHPHTRAQMWWRLAEPCRDAAELRSLCSAIASAIGGDPTVVNPGRVLRLGGSVAWPAKEGRVLERTEVHVPRDGRPQEYFLGQLLRAFAPESGPLMKAAPNGPELAAITPAASAPQRQDGQLAIGSLSVEKAIAAIRGGDRWHDHAVRLVAHWIARGWSDAEILGQAEGLTLPGWTHAQTRRDLARMVEGARRKWNVPNPMHEIAAEASPPPPIDILWADNINAAMIPRRRWLIGSFAVRGNLTVLVAPPGAGKSTLGIALAVACAIGRNELVGEHVHEPTRAWVWNNEDDQDELRRRLAAVLQHWSIDAADVRGRLGLNSGADRPLLVARLNRDGTVLRLPDIDAMAERVRANGIGLLVVDPFVETHEVDENDNAQIKAVAAMWRDVARRAECAVILVHHTGKPPAASADAWAGSLAASRGASSLAGVARIMRTLFAMSERDAERLGIAPEERHRWVRLDDAKANLSLASAKAKWFRRVSVTIANGDEVGVLVPDNPAPPEFRTDPQTEAAVMAEVDRAWRVGEPYGAHPRCGKRFYGRSLPRRLGRPPNAVCAAVEALLSRGAIEEAHLSPKFKGLRLVPFSEQRKPSPDHREPPDDE